MFTKRTIRRRAAVNRVDTAAEALAVSIGERTCVDLGFMASLMGDMGNTDRVIDELQGIIFKDPASGESPYAGLSPQPDAPDRAFAARCRRDRRPQSASPHRGFRPRPGL